MRFHEAKTSRRRKGVEKMVTQDISSEGLSPAWRKGVAWTLAIGLVILLYISLTAYRDAPPIPDRVVDGRGQVVFTGGDIRDGQEVFLKYGLMENGTIWGHGAYLGPDFSAEYLHTLGLDTAEFVSKKQYRLEYRKLSESERGIVNAEVRRLLKENRYDPNAGTLIFLEPEVLSFRKQIGKWTDYFSGPQASGGLPAKYIDNPAEIEKLTAFFAWTAWASAANRPGLPYSYTNNFPYDPLVGNTLSSDAILWSALSIIALLAATALVLFIFGRFDYLGWKGHAAHVHPRMLPGVSTESQRATIKYFVIVTMLFLLQVLVGGATAHFRADPGSFYGIDLSLFFPSNILRTWHLQLAIFWVATAYVAGGLLLAPALSAREPDGQSKGVHLLFWALILVVGGSLLGEMLGIRGLLGDYWFWFGHQGWEYLDLGRAWQVLLAAGLIFWLFLLYRAVAPAMKDPERREIAILFMCGAAAIPLFYPPAFFFGTRTHFTVVDMWRFWIIHLWVEGFFELFVTVLVAVIFFQLGVVSRNTAVRVIYLDAILFLGSGVVGTAHHWYWTGQSAATMALAAVFSAMEVVPLTLLTLDAWDFIKLTGTRCDVCGKSVAIPHKWAFYFLMAVGFWNFVGAGIFGFLINLPVVSYYEVGTLLTPNHGHAAFMGAFGMLAMALLVLALRQVLTDDQWVRPEKYIRVSFWGLNIGLLLMVLFNLFPGGVLQLWNVLNHGYWYGRGMEYMSRGTVQFIEWMRMPGDVVFIGLGVVPVVMATVLAYRKMTTHP
jgi:nitric oxide reductase subunit B